MFVSELSLLWRQAFVHLQFYSAIFISILFVRDHFFKSLNLASQIRLWFSCLSLCKDVKPNYMMIAISHHNTHPISHTWTSPSNFQYLITNSRIDQVIYNLKQKMILPQMLGCTSKINDQSKYDINFLRIG